jgi:hypothetical protein
MKAKHTPGPWHISPFKSWDKDIRICEAGVLVDHDDVDRAEAEANANLIAAAPDLLEACEDITDNPRAMAILERFAPSTAKLILAVIAKAKGEQR